jgi:hypothetical protein
MANAAMFIGGGLLSGLGKGVATGFLEQVKSERAQALADIRMKHQSAEAEKTRKHSEGLVDRRHELNLERDKAKAAQPPTGFRPGEGGAGLEFTPGGPADPDYLKRKKAAEGAAGQDPARVKEARWLVDNGIYPDLNAAYEATRTRVTMSGTDVRTKGLTWISNQKDMAGRQIYDTPEKQAAALAAYEKFVAGDTQGALKDLRSTAPKTEADQPGWMERTVKGLFGSAGADKPAKAPSGAKTPESAQGGDQPGKTRAAPDGKEYPEVTDQAGYEALLPGAIYWHAGKGQFLRKGQ